MAEAKLELELKDGSRVWINLSQSIKMIKTPEGRYILYLINGETYEIDRRAASRVESYYEDC